MWAYTPNLGVFELEERNNEYYMPSSFVKVKDYWHSKEEASIHSYKIKMKKILEEKEYLEKRISKLNNLIESTKKLYNIDELKITHPEHFLEDIKLYNIPYTLSSSNLCQEIVLPTKGTIE